MRVMLAVLVGLLSGCCFPTTGGGGGGGTPVPLPAIPGLPLPSSTTSFSGVERAGERLDRLGARNEIPQLDGAFDLFAAQTDPALDPVTDTVMLCDLRLPGTPWYQSRPDMEAALTIGSRTPLILRGENNRDATVVSAPVRTMAKGDALKIVLEDRDLFNRNDYIDSAVGTYPGHFPLLFTGGGGKLHATCRIMSSADIQTRLGLAGPAADQAIVAFDSARVLDPSAGDWGYPWDASRRATAAVEQTAALVGWTPPAVVARVDRTRDVDARWDADARADVARVAQSAAPLGTAVPLPGSVGATAQVEGVLCGSAARNRVTQAGGTYEAYAQCVLEVSVQSSGSVPLQGLTSYPPTLPGGAELEVVLQDGTTHELTLSSYLVNGRVVATAPTDLIAGVKLTLLLTASGQDLLNQATLVRLGGGGAPTFLLPR